TTGGQVMPRSFLEAPSCPRPGASPRAHRRPWYRPGIGPFAGAEPLEDRALLATVVVHVFNFDFSANPKGQPTVDPTIHVGDTIQWVFDEGAHSSTSVKGSIESWDSGVKNTPGVTFSHTFTHVGVFTYYCVIHGTDNGNGTASGMFGTITVQAAA